MMKHFYMMASLAAGLLLSLATACNQEETAPAAAEEGTTLTVGLPSTSSKTVLGPSVGGKRKVYWTDGDCLAVNGVASDPLSGMAQDATSASFHFPGVLNPPFSMLYPASFYKDASTITLPSTQAWADGSFAPGVAPLAGQMASAVASGSLSNLCSIIRLSIYKDAGVSASNLATVSFSGNDGEQVSGDFTIDYSSATISPAAASGEGKSVAVEVDQPLSETDVLDVYLVVPAGTYSHGFSVTLEDDLHRTMTKTKPSQAVLSAGGQSNLTAFYFVPSAQPTTFDIEDVLEEVLEPDVFNVKGYVVDASGNPLKGVVVSDGLQSVRTMVDGSFYMQSDIANTTFIQVSSPSGYMPEVTGGIPRFYKKLSDITPAGGVYDCGNFVMTPVANPDNFTLFITADPQPRASSINLDNVAYRSLRACESLYQDLQETAATVSGRQVYGICLGDLVHENMDLMDTYATALGTLGYPTYNIIGNHDNDPTKTDDDASAWKFESLFGPRNYSFNIGGIHFVVLDNLIMKDNGSGHFSGYDQGLTDRVWTWLQGDMSYVPTTSTVMVCAHSPMFKLTSGNERSNTAAHGSDYGALFDTYGEVHAWAGHTHVPFNYIYPSSHRHKNVQVHTLARSTGELWTNEYLSAGQPRGFTIVEVENGAVASWRFHPTKYLKSDFHGTHGQPVYNYADWTFSGSGSPKVATMKDSGYPLDESYQMHVYAPGAYGDGNVYANIFLWDGLWGAPTLSVNGGTPVAMTQVEASECYDAADKEIRDFYYNNYSLLRAAGYTANAPGEIVTVFRAPAPASGTGTVSVTDRFGNVYSRTVSW